MIELGDGRTINALGSGTIDVEMLVNGAWKKNQFTDVWYVPSIGRNLFSVTASIRRGFNFTANNSVCVFLKRNSVCLTGVLNSRGLFELKMRVCIPSEVSLLSAVARTDSSRPLPLQVWHERLAHQNKQHVVKFLTNRGIRFVNKEFFCDACALGKQHRQPFRVLKDKVTCAGEVLNADLCGPMPTSIGGSRYFLCIKDSYSKFRRVFFINNKSEVTNCVKKFYCRSDGKRQDN